MENLHKEYIYLDGMWLKEEQLLKMASNAGSWNVAEHYLCAYLTNALINGNTEAIKRVNEIRDLYQLDAIPFTNEIEINVNKKDKVADLARKKYSEKPDKEKMKLLMTSLEQLLEFHRNLFTSRNHWNGIYLVVRDRLDNTIKKSDFASRVYRITPSGWPEDLTIGDSTLSNFSHYVKYNDRDKAYYNMNKNPWESLCNAFWDIVKTNLLTND